VDRLDPWRVLVVMDIARTLLFLLLFVLFDTAGVWMILVIALLTGVAHVFFETALVVVVKDLFPGRALIRANSRIELAGQFSLILGPAAVAGLTALSSLRIALLVDALTFVASVVSLTAVRPKHHPAPRLTTLRSEFMTGLRYLASVRVILIMVITQVVVNFSLGAEKLIYYYARETLALPAFAVSAVVAAGGVGGLLGALTAPALATRIGELRLVIIGIATAGIAIGAIGLTPSFLTLAAAHLVYVWALITASLVNRTYRQRLVPRELLGRVTGTIRMLVLAVDPLGVLAAGALTTALHGDPRPAFLAAGTLVIIAALTATLAGLPTAESNLPS
jgi:MFS family permease